MTTRQGTAPLAEATARLRAAGVEAPAREARVLLAWAQGRTNTLPDLETPPPPRFAALLARRAAREPMALIRGRQGFWTLDLEVSADTLIPRADSETLVEAALAAVPERAAVRRVLDLGTGTGALLLACLVEFAGAWGVGVDVAPAAAALAARNAARHGLADRCAMVAGDWADCLGDGGFDLVLANPPYVASGALAGLMPEVTRHEPRRALDGGADGLEAYRALLPALPRLLHAEGLAVLEVGIGQADGVGRLGEASGLVVRTVRADLGGIPRAVVLGHLGPAPSCVAAKEGVGIAPPPH